MLGRGAMGSVWLADHLTLQSQVAVKFMAPAMAEDETSVRRFQQEAKAAAEIRSPHVAQVFDHGRTEDGHLYIVMELLEGVSLEKRVRDAGALRPSEVARIVGQVCKALAKAHERGIVHRDIKPSNVFVIDSGGEEFVKLLDFGVAKFSGEEAVNMTAAGNMVGTPAFMSPEQLFHGQDIDYRGDLWSVAVVAYFALTGTRAFAGKTLGELAVQIKGASFRMPTELRNDLPREIDAWFQRALHPELSARFSTAKELAQALEQVCGISTMMTSTPSGVQSQLQTFPGTALSSPSVPVPVKRDRRAPIAIGLFAALVVGGGAAGFVLIGGTTSPAAAPRAASPSPPPSETSAPSDPPEVSDPEPVSTTEPSADVEASASAPSPVTPPPPPRQHFPGASPKTKQDDRLKSAAEKLGI